MRVHRPVVAVLAALGVLALPGTGVSRAGATAPTLVDELVTSIALPTAVATAPDGRVVITAKEGEVRVVRPDGTVVTAGTYAPRLCTQREQGLVGVDVDPAFVTNRRLYLFLVERGAGDCTAANPPRLRVLRVAVDGNDVLLPATEQVLLDAPAPPAAHHVAGDVRFGADGLLYVSIGDGGCDLTDATRCAELNGNSRRLDILQGKVLRIRSDGRIPAGNPFVGAIGARRCGAPTGPEPGAGPCVETFGWGFRNPFRIASDPVTGRIHVNDVGQSSWEEVNRLRRGADYGWNLREGPCPTGQVRPCAPRPPGLADPRFSYSHAGGCSAITGGDFVPGDVWGPEYQGAYLFGDYVCGTLFALPAQGKAVPVLQNLGARSLVAMRFGQGPTAGALYYTTFAGTDAVRRLRPA